VAPYAAKTASFLVSDMPPEDDAESGGSGGASGSHVFEGEIRTEPQIKQYVPPGSPIPFDGDVPMDADTEMFQQVGPDGSTTWVRKIALPPLAPKGMSGGNGPAYHRPFLLDQGMIVTTPHIDPWMHQSFAPLPPAMIEALVGVNAIEMPTRHAFDEALMRFVGGLSPELRETATFPLDVYSEISHAVSQGLVSELSPRLQLWATCHHARPGSRKQHLILLPRDAFYHMSWGDEEKLRANYMVQIDGEGEPINPEQLSDFRLHKLDPTTIFERVPVQQQIYDILVYLHRSHGPFSTMLHEARRIGVATITWPMVEIFVRLCPLCKMRTKGPRSVPEDELRQQVAKRLV